MTAPMLEYGVQARLFLPASRRTPPLALVTDDLPELPLFGVAPLRHNYSRRAA
jgi:hypothetical protein